MKKIYIVFFIVLAAVLTVGLTVSSFAPEKPAPVESAQTPEYGPVNPETNPETKPETNPETNPETKPRCCRG